MSILYPPPRNALHLTSIDRIPLSDIFLLLVEAPLARALRPSYTGNARLPSQSLMQKPSSSCVHQDFEASPSPLKENTMPSFPDTCLRWSLRQYISVVRVMIGSNICPSYKVSPAFCGRGSQVKISQILTAGGGYCGPIPSFLPLYSCHDLTPTSPRHFRPKRAAPVCGHHAMFRDLVAGYSMFLVEMSVNAWVGASVADKTCYRRWR
jgi:hypothetical protein